MYNPKNDCALMIERLKEICKQKGIRPYMLAKKSGVANSTLSYILSGRNTPYVYTMLLLCNALDISIGDLFEEKHGDQGEDGLQYQFDGTELWDGLEENGEAEEAAEILDIYSGLSEQSRLLVKVYMKMLLLCQDAPEIVDGLEDLAKRDAE